MINYIYLNHNFIRINIDKLSNIQMFNSYCCNICNIEVVIFDDTIRQVFSSKDNKHVKYMGEILKITCDEFIIKGLIE